MNKRHKHLYKLIIIPAILLLANPTMAQRKLKQLDEQKKEDSNKKYDKPESFWDKVSFGGNIGGGFGQGVSSFLLQPQALYRVNDNLGVGMGFTYFYWSREIQYASGTKKTYSDNSYGPNLFVRQRLFSEIFGYAEYNAMNFTSFNEFGQSRRLWNQALFLGPSYVQETGRGGAYILILYDVLWRQDDLSQPGSFTRNFRVSPWDFRIGFFF
jgi:hypothetical protein